MIQSFKQFWKTHFSGEPRVEKSLSQTELKTIREFIKQSELEGRSTQSIIEWLRKRYTDNNLKWEAERIYWTESKRIERDSILQDAKALGITKFRIVPSPNACPVCLAFSDSGNRVFDRSNIIYKGHAAPPVHPNCNCLVVPL